jgi:hypothetical protein
MRHFRRKSTCEEDQHRQQPAHPSATARRLARQVR